MAKPRAKPINTYLCYRFQGDTGDRVGVLLVRTRMTLDEISPHADTPWFLQATSPSDARRFYRRLNPRARPV